jgi:hypothetical protein
MFPLNVDCDSMVDLRFRSIVLNGSNEKEANDEGEDQYQSRYQHQREREHKRRSKLKLKRNSKRRAIVSGAK